ncbi:MAG: pyridoxal-phosphate dependent enzyme [Dehalococcoidia bacterium]|nr:pyridoxal-phosphate dependent enzyme [Dehalococcoidia bacterium]
MSKQAARTPPDFTLTCHSCGEVVPSEPWEWKHSCGSPLDISVDIDKHRFRSCHEPDVIGIARFAPVLPLRSVPVTAIGDSPILTEDVDGVRVTFMLEYLNPSGSFKDRGAYITVARCAEMGFDSIVVDSSGNAGVAIARMGLRLGINVDVFLPESTPNGKKRLMRMLGARLHEVNGDRMRVHAATLAAAEQGAAYVGHWFNPYFLHGTKTIAYEAFEQMDEIDFAVAPVGAGTVLLGLDLGFSELQAADMLHTVPRLVAAQASGFNPVCTWLGVAETMAQASHLADGIAIANPPRLLQIADAVKRTGGFGETVADDGIASALRWLVARGYVVEPTSAVPFAAALAAIRDRRIPAGSSVLIPLSGTGMKVLDELTEIVSHPLT